MNANLDISLIDNQLQVTLGGTWKLGQSQPDTQPVVDQLTSAAEISSVTITTRNLDSWDTTLITTLLKIIDACWSREITVHYDALPQGVKRLLRLATAVPERKGDRREAKHVSIVDYLGTQAIARHRSYREMLQFIGEAFIGCAKLALGRARFPFSEMMVFVQDAGFNALPIISLISVLFGVILAFVGAVQLKLFGAELFVADLVGIGMARDMGAMMTGVIMAGRTGAAFAAQLGTMQVNEEIDALTTFGISPMEYLVLPRMLALTMMMPLLCIYSDLMGILGGALIGIGLFDITPTQYFLQTQKAVPLHHFASGLIKSLFYGVIVALTGCLRGIQCGRSASAVGTAATSAVVTAITWIVICCAILTFVFYVIGI